MLQSIRDRTHGWIAGIIVSLLILSFALWGIHSYIGGGSDNPFVAKVNGVQIPKNQLAAAYERMRRQVQVQSGLAQLPLQLETTLKEKALQSIINLEVLKQASLDQGYRISSLQVDGFLQSMPEFQVNGQFSLERFQQILQTTMYSPGDFLELLRSSLLIDQPRLGIILSSFALPEEINSAIALVNQERDVQYAQIPMQIITKQPITISDNDIKNYYVKHQDAFKTLEQVSVEYIELTLKDLMNAIHPTDDQLQKFYSENSSSYTQPFSQVKDKVKDAYIRQQAQEQFANLREKMATLTYEHPESLALAAKELGLKIQTSDTFSKDKGGKDISTHPKVRDMAFSNDVLSLQNNSDVIQLNSDDAVVIRIKTHNPATVLSLDNVRDKISEQLKAKELESRAQTIANEITQKLTHDVSVESVSEEYGLTWTKLGFIKRHAEKSNPIVVNVAFSLPKPVQGPSYAPVKLTDGYGIVGVYGIRDGVMSDKDTEFKAFAEQVQNSQGLMEYELYKQNLISQAKVSLE